MYMNEKLTRYLYTAYVEIAATEICEDLNTGLAYAEQILDKSLTREEKECIWDFLRYYEDEMAGIYRQGYTVFSEKVKKYTEEMKAKDEKEQ